MPIHESLIGQQVIDVLKCFGYTQLFFENNKGLNVYGVCKVASNEFQNGEVNALLKSLIGSQVTRIDIQSTQLTLNFSKGQVYTVEGNEESEAYNFFSLRHPYDQTKPNSFRPSMELTDAFYNAARILRRLDLAAEGSMKALGFITKEHGGAGDIRDGISFYEWQWMLEKESSNGDETYRRTVTLSFKQNDLLFAELPVLFTWTVDIFRNGQPIRIPKSGQLTRLFKEIEEEGVEKYLVDAAAQAEAELLRKDFLQLRSSP